MVAHARQKPAGSCPRHVYTRALPAPAAAAGADLTRISNPRFPRFPAFPAPTPISRVAREMGLLREPHRRILGHVVGDWRSLAGSLRTASVGSSRLYIPQVFFCRSVRGFDPKSRSLFLPSGSMDFVFCPPFFLLWRRFARCCGAPRFGVLSKHSETRDVYRVPGCRAPASRTRS